MHKLAVTPTHAEKRNGSEMATWRSTAGTSVRALSKALKRLHFSAKKQEQYMKSPIRVCNRLSGYSGYSDIRKNLSVRIVIYHYSDKSIIGFVLFEITGL